MAWHERRRGEQDIFSLASFGFFLALIGVLWVITPNLSQKVVDFFKDFESREEVFPKVFLPAPVHFHPVVYTTVARFCFVFGIFQIFILVLRLAFREPVDRIAGTISSMVFWFGAGFVSSALSVGTIKWFGFLGWLIVFIGLSLVVRSFMILSFDLTLQKR